MRIPVFIPINFIKENIGESTTEFKPGLTYAMRQAQVNIKFDHTTSIIRPQAFGRMRPRFRFHKNLIVATKNPAIFNRQTVYDVLQ